MRRPENRFTREHAAGKGGSPDLRGGGPRRVSYSATTAPSSTGRSRRSKRRSTRRQVPGLRGRLSPARCGSWSTDAGRSPIIRPACRNADSGGAVLDQRSRDWPGSQPIGTVLFRIIGGLGVGMASVIAPAYIAEISPARIRGRLGSLQQLAIVTGIFISLLIDFLFAGRRRVWPAVLVRLDAWRWMFLAMAVPAVIYGVLSFTIPESPRFLIAKHKITRQRRSSPDCWAANIERRSSGSGRRWNARPSRLGMT